METISNKKNRLKAEIAFAEQQLEKNLEKLDSTSFLPATSTVLPLITGSLFKNPSKIAGGLEHGSKLFLSEGNILRILIKNYSLVFKGLKTILS